MSHLIATRPLTPHAFAPFGDVLEAVGAPDMIINQGLCARFHDRARLDFSDGQAGLSLFQGQPRALPLRLEMMERHPRGTQAFVPMSHDPFLVVVAADAGGAPGRPLAFVTTAGQAINFHRGTWHGVLTPLHAPALFAVIDRIGGADGNLEEHWFPTAYTIENA